MTLVSIIMPCYNAEKYLSEAIDSVLQQSFEDIELIAVDDGSSDNTLSILRTYSKQDTRLKILSQSNSGVSLARNRGIEHATGKYLAFLDADDWWNKSFIEKMFATIENDNCCLVYCGWQNVGMPGEKGEPFVPPDYENLPDKMQILFAACRWPIHAVLVRRDMFENTGGFNSNYRTSEDYAIWLRIAIKNKISRLPEVLAFYRHHEDEQATSNREQLIFDHLLVQKDFLKHYPEVAVQLGKKKIRKLTYGELLKKGFEAYWKRDLKLSRCVFRYVFWVGYFKFEYLKYILPAFLPLFLHKKLIEMNDEV